ncbi:unnamed protein product [Pneumocystis jirovecii]|uniref:RRM domain-containing protein n=1 Tax=Pneumocystis jirovecii TaxID=42068 RepID=L0PFZ2_PNEJI|nr:unnamed protein product [Pneumocystis jirovecii]
MISTKRKRSSEKADVLTICLDSPSPLSRKNSRKLKKQKIQGSSGTFEKKVKISNKPGNKGKYCVWIGNLEFHTTRKDILNFFLEKKPISNGEEIQFHDITRIHIPKKNKTENKGFAYVDFSSLSAMKASLKRSEDVLNGRNLLIKDANDFERKQEKLPNEKDSNQKSDSEEIKQKSLRNIENIENTENTEKHKKHKKRPIHSSVENNEIVDTNKRLRKSIT